MHFILHLTLIAQFNLPATVCPRQALTIYCILIKCSTTFDHFSSVNLHNTHRRLTSSVHWWFPNHLKSAKSIFVQPGTVLFEIFLYHSWNYYEWFKLCKGFPISNLDVCSRNGVNLSLYITSQNNVSCPNSWFSCIKKVSMKVTFLMKIF